MSKKIILIVSLVSLVILASCTSPPTIEQEVIQDIAKDVMKSEIVQLEDGDNYEISAEMIHNEINGQRYDAMGYNGSIPGPTIKVKQGSQISLNFTNNTNIPNTLHSHGIRLDNQYDGVPNVTQAPVEPGESFEYKIKFPDPGVYWYHPHMREDLTQELGLYGLFVVEPDEENYWNPVNREEYVFLDDILMKNNGIAKFDEKLTNFALMGRFGNTMLINGETEYNLNVKKGEVIRFAFANSANTRDFNIVIPGVSQKLVGADSGRYEKEEVLDEFIIAPSERVIFEAYFPDEGQYQLLHKTPAKTYNLGFINVSSEEVAIKYDEQFNELRNNGGIREAIEDFDTYLSKAPDKKLRLSIDIKGMGGMMMDDGNQTSTGMPCHQMGNGMMMGDCDEENIEHEDEQKIEWEDDMAMMNAMSNNETVTWEIIDEDTELKNMDIDWEFGLGDYMKISIFNDPDSAHPMQHPIHFHGQRFLILKTNDELNDNLVWKDTTLIQTGDTVEILLEVSNPGEWMAHCHIAEHLHSDMMFSFDVIK